MTESFAQKIVVLGTGGTIAGLAMQAHDNVAYRAAQRDIGQLLQDLPLQGLPAHALVAEQVAQLDSKDMTVAAWSALALRCHFWLDDPTVAGIVVTHGTDTLEETAFFLHHLLARTGGCRKPLVLTGAMRPASAQAPDGPQNLRDALAVAADRRAAGVSVVFAGMVHGPRAVHKLHPYRLNAFSSGESGLRGVVEEGRLRPIDALPWSSNDAHAGADPDRQWLAWRLWMQPDQVWPRVEIVVSHAGVDGQLVEALLVGAEAQGRPVRGIVVAASGNGSVHASLETALLRAQGMGIAVQRASRCMGSAMVPNPAASLPDAAGLSPVKSRIALMLDLLAADAAGTGSTAVTSRP